jgi:hypothetical protein
MRGRSRSDQPPLAYLLIPGFRDIAYRERKGVRHLFLNTFGEKLYDGAL